MNKRGHCQFVGRHSADDEDCTITGVETQHGPACSIDGEPLFEEALLAVMQDRRNTGPMPTPTRRTS
jgi:hypothetical protein